jgi:hypothetical protein
MIFIIPIIILLSVFRCYAINFTGTSLPEIIIQQPESTLKVGERLDYSVRWMGIHIGDAYMHIEDIVLVGGKPCYRIRVATKTRGLMEKIYPVRNKVHSYIDIKGMFSRKFEKKQQEGGYRSNKTILFDPIAKIGFYESKLNGNKKTFEIPGKVQDTASSIYAFRLLRDIEIGNTNIMKVHCGEKTIGLEIRILRTEHVELGGRVIPCFVVQPIQKFEGQFMKRARKFYIYFTADSKRIPVKIRVHTSHGPVVAILNQQQVDGLKLTSIKEE